MSKPSLREIMDGFEASRAKTFFYMAQALIDELGEEKGRQVIRDTVWKMSKTSGEATRKQYQENGIDNTWENHRVENGPVYAVAWIGGTIINEPQKKVIEYTHCPFGVAFTRMGKDAEELGDIYCSVTDMPSGRDSTLSGVSHEKRPTAKMGYVASSGQEIRG